MDAAGGQFLRLFEPLRVGGLTLRNRIVMGAMHTRLECGADGARRLAAFYAERARGGVGMIITGGVAPEPAGRIDEDSAVLDSPVQLRDHRLIVDSVHAAGAPICLQILHAGRYAKVAEPVGASEIPSRINRTPPRALADTEVDTTISAFVRCAGLARDAGYDAVEVMGSEGYLISQFTCARTNTRTDRWGGSLDQRMRMPLEVVRGMRASLGASFPILFRISALDLVEQGLDGAETIALARALAQAGVDLFDTGIGWHEARVPTIAHMVPRAAFAFAVGRLKAAVNRPVLATNRINTPQLAEQLLADGVADAVALARPFLADPEFAAKARAGRADEINTCIACNQACLDRIFARDTATCLVNPRAARELDWPLLATERPRRVAVVGAGAAGLSCAVAAAECGHAVTLFEAGPEIGGQMRLAAAVPGKEFAETLRYFRRRLDRLAVDVRLGTRVEAVRLAQGGFDEIVVATGVVPRVPALASSDPARILRYDQVLSGAATVGERVAIIGAGGIGFDVALFLSQPRVQDFLGAWGIDGEGRSAGGLLAPVPEAVPRKVWLLQRRPGPAGLTLGTSTGWAVRAELARRGVAVVTGVQYQRVDAEGLWIEREGRPECLPVEHVVLCAGQEPVRALYDELLGGAACVCT